jgi:hypothetical protein
MPIIISTNGQTRCRNSYASSAQARLSLRVNGEQAPVVITDAGALVQAGFDSPTVLPTVGTNGAGNVPVGFYVYRYVYVSSRYPFVANDVTVDGEEWPRSNPSPPSATYQVTPAAESNAVTVTYSTRTDVDWIAVYRTPNGQTTAALAEAFDAAGELYFVEMVANNSAGGTTVVTDNNATNSGERIEADNFPCALFRQTIFDGFYWWGWGNRNLVVPVILDATGTVTLDTAQSDVDTWFSGRDTTPAGLNLATGPNSNSINFLGITTGGYDGRGNFYLRVTSPTTLSVYNSSAMLTPTAIPATGTTTAYLTSPTSTLYRSKPLNPFSWGETTVTANPDGRTFTRVPTLYAKKIGGGIGTAISLIANERILKLDTEAPERAYALDLNAADSDQFVGTLRTLDTAQSTGSHFSVFPMRLPSGQSVSSSVNAKAVTLLSADGQSQIPIGDEVFETMHKIRREDGEAPFFHGVYDRNADLNCWWVKTTDGLFRCDTLIYQHVATGKWGTKFMPGVSASWTVYDPTTENYYTFVGTENMTSASPQGGMIGAAFYPDRYRDWITDFKTAPTGEFEEDVSGLEFTIDPIATIATVTGTAPSWTVTTTGAHGLSVGQVIVIAQGNPVTVPVLTVPSPTTFTVSSYNITTSVDGMVVDPIFSSPWVAWNPVTNALYLANPFDPFDVNVVNNSGVFVFANPGGESGINLNTGEYETDFLGDGNNWIAYWGCVPCFVTRWFNGSAPEKNKTNREVWATQQNVDANTNAQWLKFYIEYRTALVATPTATNALVQMTRDTVGSGGLNGNSDAYSYKTPPDLLAHAYGLGMMELGYEAWRFMDLTFKQQQT